MKKVLLWVGGIIAFLALLLVFGYQYMISQTKQASPEQTIEYSTGDTKLSVFYNRPSKKNRVIFGELVPYGEVWRTGANEATTFETNQDIVVGGKPLAGGIYTLWTIPQEDSWTFLVNEKQYGWGVSFGAKASRDPAADVVSVEVPVELLDAPVEMFTMAFEEDSTGLALTLSWDQTRILVPISL